MKLFIRLTLILLMIKNVCAGPSFGFPGYKSKKKKSSAIQFDAEYKDYWDEYGFDQCRRIKEQSAVANFAKLSKQFNCVPPEENTPKESQKFCECHDKYSKQDSDSIIIASFNSDMEKYIINDAFINSSAAFEFYNINFIADTIGDESGCLSNKIEENINKKTPLLKDSFSKYLKTKRRLPTPKIPTQKVDAFIKATELLNMIETESLTDEVILQQARDIAEASGIGDYSAAPQLLEAALIRTLKEMSRNSYDSPEDIFNKKLKEKAREVCKAVPYDSTVSFHKFDLPKILKERSTDIIMNPNAEPELINVLSSVLNVYEKNEENRFTPAQVEEASYKTARVFCMTRQWKKLNKDQYEQEFAKLSKNSKIQIEQILKKRDEEAQKSIELQQRYSELKEEMIRTCGLECIDGQENITTRKLTDDQLKLFIELENIQDNIDLAESNIEKHSESICAISKKVCYSIPDPVTTLRGKSYVDESGNLRIGSAISRDEVESLVKRNRGISYNTLSTLYKDDPEKLKKITEDFQSFSQRTSNSKQMTITEDFKGEQTKKDAKYSSADFFSPTKSTTRVPKTITPTRATTYDYRKEQQRISKIQAQQVSAKDSQSIPSDFISNLNQKEIDALNEKIDALEQKETKVQDGSQTLKDVLAGLNQTLSSEQEELERLQKEIDQQKTSVIDNQRQQKSTIQQGQGNSAQRGQTKTAGKEQRDISASSITSPVKSSSVSPKGTTAEGSTSRPQGQVATDKETNKILLAIKNRYYAKDAGINLTSFLKIKDNPELLMKHYKDVPEEFVVHTSDGDILVRPIIKDNKVVDFDYVGKVTHDQVITAIEADQEKVKKEQEQLFSYDELQKGIEQAQKK
jgi:hypothetical protein